MGTVLAILFLGFYIIYKDIKTRRIGDEKDAI